MAIPKTREQRRRENHEHAFAAYLEHHAAAVALISRIQIAVAKHDTAPDPKAIALAGLAAAFGQVPGPSDLAPCGRPVAHR